MPEEPQRGMRRVWRRGAKRSVSIRYSLARNLMLMILLTSGGILVVSHLSSGRIVAELSEELISEKISQTEQELEKFLMPVRNGLLMFRAWGEAGLLERVDPEQIRPPGAPPPEPDTTSLRLLNARFIPLLTRFHQVSSLMVGNTAGEEYLLLRGDDHWLSRVTEVERWGSQTFWMRREADGRYTQEYWKDLDYDPRKRPWFTGALAAAAENGVHWTPPYKFFTTKDPGITASVTWHSPGDESVTSVIAFDVMLIDLSRFTTSLSISERGKVLVLTDGGAVLGLPRDERFRSLEEIRSAVLTQVDALGVPELADGARAARKRRVRGDKPFTFRSGRETWWAGARTFRLGEQTLRTVAVVPEQDFLAGVVRQRNTVLAITGGALVVAFFVALALARRYSRPLAALAAQASRIQELDLTPADPIDSHITEVNQLADNQSQMVTALQSFSRYVPFELVRELLRLGEVASIGGRSANLTVLFSDIRGFTSIAEQMTPEGLTVHLAEYFEAMLGILQSERATVDKLVGDAIMAFWGAPLSDPAHASHAVTAVVRCQQRLAELNAQWTAQGKPELPTCFGLDMGPLVVGNVGAPNRLNYTVLGDTVNLASRIEGLNRHYGTDVLASEAVKDAAGDEWRWRLVDVVAVKGKHDAVRVYELLGARSDTSDEALAFARAYEAAFACYQSRDFRGALERLTRLGAERAGDRSVAVLMRACERFIRTPPEAAWDGVTRLERK